MTARALEIRMVLTVAALASVIGAAGCQAGEQLAGDGGPELAEVAQPLDGTIDFADYMLPNCNGPSVPQYFPPEVFRTVPLGGNRFAVVKNLQGTAFEDWTVDSDWLRIKADYTWAYQMNGDWCDTECRMNNQHPGTACNHRWENDPAVYANTLYRDPANSSLGAPFIKRRMQFVGGVFRYPASMKITGQNRNSCGTCATNFDTTSPSGDTRHVLARRHASKSYTSRCNTQRTFSDVIELFVERGPGEGETAVYARGQGFIGFGGRGQTPKVACWPDASVATPAPTDGCGAGGPIQSICSALGRGCPCRPGTPQDNACYYSQADRIACGLPAAGCSGDWWVTGWNLYRQVCRL